MKVTLHLNNEDTQFELLQEGQEITVHKGEETAVFRLLHTDNHIHTLERIWPDGRRTRVTASMVAKKDDRQTWLNGRTVRYTRVRKQAGGGADASAGSLSATIPAVVSSVLVNVGDDVAEGEKLILLESMKMVIPIQAPYAGQVTAVHCTAGDAVQPGVPLIELEDNSDS